MVWFFTHLLVSFEKEILNFNVFRLINWDLNAMHRTEQLDLAVENKFPIQ